MKHLLHATVLASLLTAALPAFAAETNRPVVGVPGPTTATAGVAVNVTATVTDDTGIASCNLYVDSNDEGAMTITGSTASKSYVYAQAGVHTIFVFCRDVHNNFQSGDNASVSVSPGSGDTTSPTVGQISPVTAVAGASTMLSATVSDQGSGVSACVLAVDGFSKGSMTISGQTATISYTFSNLGNYSVYAQCNDVAGNTAAGLTAVVTVAGVANPTPGLIKLACPAGSLATHPCRAVYYRGTDNKRHAFPNAKVYATWYADFSNVAEVSASVMASYQLGPQVTYRPGSRLVKFTTLNRIYAVARGGTLRWVMTETVARDLYGLDWNKKVDDINDAFYTDYRFGTDIDASSDYSPSGEMAATTTIDANF